MTDRIHLLAERLWALVALAAAGVAIYDIATLGWTGGRMSLLFPAIAGTWYLTRRALRRKVEASASRETEGSENAD